MVNFKSCLTILFFFLLVGDQGVLGKELLSTLVLHITTPCWKDSSIHVSQSAMVSVWCKCHRVSYDHELGTSERMKVRNRSTQASFLVSLELNPEDSVSWPTMWAFLSYSHLDWRRGDIRSAGESSKTLLKSWEKWSYHDSLLLTHYGLSLVYSPVLFLI